MTEVQLKRALRIWMQRLGLSHWRLTVCFDGDPNDFVAQTRCGRYDYATLTFADDHRSWTEFDANQTIVHELLHLLTRDLDYCGRDDVLSLLNAQARKLYGARFLHEIEGLVDRLATVFVELAGPA